MITKRQLGYGFTAVGLALALGPFLLDLVRASAYGGIGPAQQLALQIGLALLLLGLSLIPLGNKPA
jgi:hypothetical protein